MAICRLYIKFVTYLIGDTQASKQSADVQEKNGERNVTDKTGVNFINIKHCCIAVSPSDCMSPAYLRAVTSPPASAH